jgi:hypothetical protein
MHRILIVVVLTLLALLWAEACRAQGLPTKQEAAELNRTVRHVQKSEALISSGGTVDRDMKNWFHSTPLPMMLCADQPMEYETIVIPEAGVTLGMAH